MRTSPLVITGLLAAAALPLRAQQDTLPAAETRVHTVQPGETLWDIARGYLNDPFLWPEIFRLNTARVADPALIYPRQRLMLPAGTTGAASVGGDRTIFFPVEQDRVSRVGDLRRENTTAITEGDFYRASLLARPEEITAVGRVKEPISPTIVPIELSPQIQPHDRILVTLASPAGMRLGDRLHFLRQSTEVEPFGRIYISTGLGTVAAIDGTAATVVVTRLFDRVEPGDLATPASPFLLRRGVGPAGDGAALDARIVGFPTEHAVRAIEELAFIDAGRAQGVKEGDEFEAYLPAARTATGTEPPVAIARLQVVRVTERTATVRVESLDQPALDAGLPVRRVARMP